MVANAATLDSAFDFNCTSIWGLNLNEFDESFLGMTNYDTGDICIGAKIKIETGVLGVLAHELTHYAMQLIYENEAKPYFENDPKQRETFYGDIVAEYMKMKKSWKAHQCCDKWQNIFLSQLRPQNLFLQHWSNILSQWQSKEWRAWNQLSRRFFKGFRNFHRTNLQQFSFYIFIRRSFKTICV